MSGQSYSRVQTGTKNKELRLIASPMQRNAAPMGLSYNSVIQGYRMVRIRAGLEHGQPNPWARYPKRPTASWFVSGTMWPVELATALSTGEAKP